MSVLLLRCAALFGGDTRVADSGSGSLAQAQALRRGVSRSPRAHPSRLLVSYRTLSSRFGTLCNSPAKQDKKVVSGTACSVAARSVGASARKGRRALLNC